MKLRIWWIPQIPMEPMYVPVDDLNHAAQTLHLLAYYDLFQYEKRIKPDYSNAGGLQQFEMGEWSDWYDEETGASFDEWMEENGKDYISWLITKKEIEK
jgi:hypothetical protein